MEGTLGAEVRPVRMSSFLDPHKNCVLRVKGVFAESPLDQLDIKADRHFLIAVKEFFYSDLDDFMDSVHLHFV